MTEHQRVVAAIESSRLFSALDRLVTWLSLVVEHSQAGAWLASVAASTAALPAHLLRFALGIVFVVGAGTHVLVLLLLLGPRDSWLWPLLPLSGAVVGVVLLLFGTADTRAE